MIIQPTQTFLDGCKTIGLELSDQEIQGLGRYLHLLLETNKQFNLTGIREPEQAWMRHILESLGLIAHIEGPMLIVDVGSGGGLPGLPLAICLPEVEMTLIEATAKKANFLQGVVDDLGLKNVKIINERAEVAGQDPLYRQTFDLAVSRAVGKMSEVLELCIPLVKVGGRVMTIKGKRVQEEMQEAADALAILGTGEIELFEALPGMEDEAVIVEVAKEHPTAKAYPRQAGTPKHQPL